MDNDDSTIQIRYKKGNKHKKVENGKTLVPMCINGVCRTREDYGSVGETSVDCYRDFPPYDEPSREKVCRD